MAIAELPSHPPEPGLVESDVSDGFDFARLLAVVRFALRAARRRPLRTAGIFLVGWVATLVGAEWAPRAYTVSTKILVQNTNTIPFLSNPHRAAQTEQEATTPKGVAESILRRDTIVAVVDETHLAARWEPSRPPALKLLDRVRRAISGPPSREEDKAAGLVRMLEKDIEVHTDDASITISLEWHDPEGAYQIVSALQRQFLEDRAAAETAAATETIAILEEEAARQRETISTAFADARKLAQSAVRPRGAGPRPREAAAAGEPSAGEGDVATELGRKRRAVQGMEDAWQRRRSDLTAKLEGLRVTYAPAHPSVIALEEQIRQAAVEPPELRELKQAEDTLLERVKSLSRAEGPPSVEAELGSPDLAPAKARLRAAIHRYEDLNDRIDSARIELGSARAAFKYRYAVIQRPEVPARPTSPNLLLIALAGLTTSLVLAVGAAYARELASERFVEVWQVEQLPIPLLAQIGRRPALARGGPPPEAVNGCGPAGPVEEHE